MLLTSPWPFDAGAIRLLRCGLSFWRCHITKVLGLEYECGRNWRCRLRTITTAFHNHCDCQLRLLKGSDTEKPGVDTWMFVIHDCLFIFANDVALVILLDAVAFLLLTCFGIVERHNFLRRASFPTRVYSRGFNRTKDSSCSPAWSTGDESHDLALSLRGLRCDH